MKQLVKIAIAIVTLVTTFTAFASSFEMTILHINDHHSHLSEEDFDLDVADFGLSTTTEDGSAIAEVEVTYGGFPRLVTLFNELEDKYDNVLKLHAGDAITGTLYYSLFRGEADAAMMNQVCFDAFALGNHEFDDGDSGLANFLNFLNASDDCDTPALAANVVPADDSAIAEGFIQPYIIKEFDGEKVGVIGIDIADKTKNSSSPDEGTEFLDETETAQKVIDELTAQGIDKIILVTHQQYANDIEMAANLTGVDVIVGGDSHSLLGDESLENAGFNPVGDYPTKVVDADGNNVCIVQAWEYAHLVGELRVVFDDYGRVRNCKGQPVLPISVDFVYEYNDDEDRVLAGKDQKIVSRALTRQDEFSYIEPDSETTELLATFDAQVSVLQQTVIGTVAEDLCLVRWPGESRSAICDVADNYENGSDISNIVARAFLEVTPTADIAIQNAGGVRIDIDAGDFTIGDAFTLLPFSNTLVTLEMTGQQIVDVLEEALSNTLDAGGSTGSYPYASGLRYTIDASASFGNRVSNVEVNSRVAGAWVTIDLAETYTVVTNDFIASGRDGYTTFGEVFSAGDFVDTFTEYAQGFISYVERLTADGLSLQRLPIDEYSTQEYTGRDGCNHSTDTDCVGF